MSVEQTDDGHMVNLTRRQALKSMAAAGTAAAVGGAASGPALGDCLIPGDPTCGDDSALDDVGWTEVGAAAQSPAAFAISYSLKAKDEIEDIINGWRSGDTNNAQQTEIQKDASWDFRRYHNSAVRELNMRSDTLEYVVDGIFADAKLAAIEEINNQAEKATVEQAALDEAKEALAGFQKQIVASGNQGIRTIVNYLEQIDEIDAVSVGQVFENAAGGDGAQLGDPSNVTTSTETIDLLNGEQMNVLCFDPEYANNDVGPGSWANVTESNQGVYGTSTYYTIYAIEPDADKAYPVLPVKGGTYGPSGSGDYALPDKYNHGATLWNQWQNLLDAWENDLKPDIQGYVTNAYDEVARGEIAPGDLLTARDVANTVGEDEPQNRALAHLRAANIPVKPDHPVSIETRVNGRTMQLVDVLLSSTGETDSVSTGDTVDPSTVDHSYFVSYRPQDVVVQWPDTAYQDTIDGGTLTLTELPDQELEEWLTQGIIMQVQTIADETATINVVEEFGPDRDPSPSGGVDVDLNDQLNTEITEVAQIQLFTAVEESPYATNSLRNTFTVTQIEGKDALDFSHDRQIQSTDNYVTKEEWEERNEAMQQILEELEEDDDGGGGIGFPDFGGGGLFSGIAGAIGTAAFFILLLFVVSLINLAGYDADVEDFQR